MSRTERLFDLIQLLRRHRFPINKPMVNQWGQKPMGSESIDLTETNGVETNGVRVD